MGQGRDRASRRQQGARAQKGIDPSARGIAVVGQRDKTGMRAADAARQPQRIAHPRTAARGERQVARPPDHRHTKGSHTHPSMRRCGGATGVTAP